MKVLYFILFGVIFSFVKGQECGSDVFEDYLKRTYSKYDEDQAVLKSYLRPNQRIGLDECQMPVSSYIIPVVFHVMYTNAEDNISEASIDSALAITNQQWASMGIKFKKALRDPDGNPTNGITRTDCSSIPEYVQYGIDPNFNPIGALDTAIKKLSIWPRDEYLNIWVVNKIVGSSGYANAPSGYKYEGVVVVYYIQSPAFNRGSALIAHEIGHYMNLKHTFAGSTSSACAPNNDCTIDGDEICDTPPIKQIDCNYNSCGRYLDSLNSLKNIMGYCGKDIFTPLQRERAYLAALSPFRWSLFASNALIPHDVMLEVEPEAISFVENLDQPICDGNLTPLLEIRSLGIQNIDSMVLSIYIDDILDTILHVIVNISQNTSQVIELAQIPVRHGPHSIRISIDKINQSLTDFNPLNNQFCSSYYVFPNEVTVTATIFPPNAGSVTGTGSYHCDGNYTLFAHANSGFTFAGWRDDLGWLVSTDSIYPFLVNINAQNSFHLTAEFSVLTGLNSNIKSPIKIYPNPGYTTLMIETDIHSLTQIAVLDEEGRKLETGYSSNGMNMLMLDIGSYPNGIYTLVVKSKQSIQSHRFIVQ